MSGIVCRFICSSLCKKSNFYACEGRVILSVKFDYIASNVVLNTYVLSNGKNTIHPK